MLTLRLYLRKDTAGSLWKTYPLSLRLNDNHIQTRIHNRLLGPCFKTGKTKQSSTHKTDAQELLLRTFHFHARIAPIWSHRSINLQQYRRTHICFVCFSSSNFRYSLTLFPKFLSSFPHGTFVLSVFLQYCSFDEIYHLFVLQSQTERLISTIVVIWFTKKSVTCQANPSQGISKIQINHHVVYSS